MPTLGLFLLLLRASKWESESVTVRQQHSQKSTNKDGGINYDALHFWCCITFLAWSSLITTFTPTLCERQPSLPMQTAARVGGLMEYGSNWPPIHWYGLQVFGSLVSAHRWMHCLSSSSLTLPLNCLDVLFVQLYLQQSSLCYIVLMSIAWPNQISQISGYRPRAADITLRNRSF